jgi:hypothetical protein
VTFFFCSSLAPSPNQSGSTPFASLFLWKKKFLQPSIGHGIIQAFYPKLLGTPNDLGNCIPRVTGTRTDCSLTDLIKIQFKDFTTINHKKTSCIILSCIFACILYYTRGYLIYRAGSNSADGGSLFRTDRLKTPHMRLNSYAIIIFISNLCPSQNFFFC